jgi:hypothetical protein
MSAPIFNNYLINSYLTQSFTIVLFLWASPFSFLCTQAYFCFYNIIIHKVPQVRDKNNGFDPSLRKLSNKSLLACHVTKPIFESWMNFFETSSFHLQNLERVEGSQRGYVLGTQYPKPEASYARLAWPTTPSRTN